MDIVFKAFSRDFKKVLGKRKMDQENGISERTAERILDLIYRIKVSVHISAVRNYFEDIHKTLVDFKTILEFAPEDKLADSLGGIEQELINYLATELKIPFVHFSKLLKASLANIEYPSISSLLPKFLELVIQSNLQKNSTNLDISYMDFKIELSKFMILMSTGFNHFTNQVAKQVICGNVLEDDFGLNINFYKVHEFLELFFGSKRNYKFYGKMNSLTQPLNLKPMNYMNNITLSLTKPRVAYKGPTKVLPVSPMMVTYKGLEKGKMDPSLDENQEEVNLENFRNDGIIVFGKHPKCDVRLPADDPEVDNVAMILYNSLDNYYLIDCSKKNPCCFKLFDYEDPDEGKKTHPIIVQSHIYSFAKTMMFVAQDISFASFTQSDSHDGETTLHYNYDEERTHSVLKLKCLSRPYENQEFILKTSVHKKPQEMKLVHNIGSGGEIAFPPDIFIPKEKGISKIHAQIIFDPDTSSWYLADKESLNGTFRILKTEDQYLNKKPSGFCKLFKEGYDSNGNLSVFTVCNYSFCAILLENNNDT